MHNNDYWMTAVIFQGEEDDTVYFDLKMLNFTTASVAVRDLWQHQDLGIFTGL